MPLLVLLKTDVRFLFECIEQVIEAFVLEKLSRAHKWYCTLWFSGYQYLFGNVTVVVAIAVLDDQFHARAREQQQSRRMSRQFKFEREFVSRHPRLLG